MSKLRENSVLSPGNLRRVLDASRAARPLPATPLRAFAVIQQRMMEPSVSEAAAVDFVLMDWLVEVITLGLRNQRQHYHLPEPVDDLPLTGALDQIVQDFSQGALELEAWSLLYFRYVRVDLDLPWEQLETVTAQDQRTLRRRQERGLARLIHELLQRERDARRANHTDRMRRMVPHGPAYPLVGRQALIDQAWRRLAGDGGRRHLVLVGPGGIGKTVLAADLTHRLIDTVKLDNVIWLTPPPDLQAADLAGYCVEVMNVPFLGEDTLRLYCQTHDLLIVLDEAESLLSLGGSSTVFQAFLDQVTEARLIVISRFLLPDVDLHVIRLPELQVDEALAVMERTWPFRHALDSLRREVIWQQAGGNPLALEVATKLVARLPQSSLADDDLPAHLPDQIALLQNLYECAWNQLEEQAMRFWLVTWLLPPTHILHDLAMLAGGFDAITAAQAVQQLRQLSLLDVDPSQERYILHSVARAYLQEKLRNHEKQHWIRTASRRLSGAVLGAPYASQLALHLIEQADLLGLTVPDRVKLLEAAWPNITHQGLWATWRPVIEALLTEARRETHRRALTLLHGALGVTYRWLGRYDLAEPHLQESLRFADQSNGQHDYAQALVELTVVYRYQRRLESAQKTAHYALAEFRQLRDYPGIERCTLELAQLALDLGKPEDSLTQLEPVAYTARAAALACNAHLMLGNLQEALVHAEQAVTLAASDRPNQARAQAVLGRVYLELGRLPEAEDHLALALSLLEQQRDMMGWARAASTLAQVYHLSDRWDEAEALLEDAAGQQRILHDGLGLEATLQTQLTVYSSLAQRALGSGKLNQADDLAARIREIDMEWHTFSGRRVNHSR